jgi:hypothetical protein
MNTGGQRQERLHAVIGLTIHVAFMTTNEEVHGCVPLFGGHRKCVHCKQQQGGIKLGLVRRVILISETNRYFAVTLAARAVFFFFFFFFFYRDTVVSAPTL